MSVCHLISKLSWCLTLLATFSWTKLKINFNMGLAVRWAAPRLSHHKIGGLPRETVAYFLELQEISFGPRWIKWPLLRAAIIRTTSPICICECIELDVGRRLNQESMINSELQISKDSFDCGWMLHVLTNLFIDWKTNIRSCGCEVLKGANNIRSWRGSPMFLDNLRLLAMGVRHGWLCPFWF